MSIKANNWTPDPDCKKCKRSEQIMWDMLQKIMQKDAEIKRLNRKLEEYESKES